MRNAATLEVSSRKPGGGSAEALSKKAASMRAGREANLGKVAAYNERLARGVPACHRRRPQHPRPDWFQHKGAMVLALGREREHQDVSASAAGSDLRPKRSVRSVSRIAVKPTMTLTQLSVSFMPTLKATSADCDARPRRV